MAIISLPRLLDPATGGVHRLDVEGNTLGAVIDELLSQIPGLEVHLFDHGGSLRPHVLCFVDGEPSRLEDRTVEADPNTDVRFLQAVSGG